MWQAGETMAYVDYFASGMRENHAAAGYDTPDFKWREALPGTMVGVVDERSELGGAYRGIPKMT